MSDKNREGLPKHLWTVYRSDRNDFYSAQATSYKITLEDVIRVLQAGAVDAIRKGAPRAQTAPRGSLTGSRMMFLAEVVLFRFRTAVYVGLAILFRWSRRTPESGAK